MPAVQFRNTIACTIHSQEVFMKHLLRGTTALLLSASMCLAVPTASFAGVVKGAHRATESAETAAVQTTDSTSSGDAVSGIVNAPGSEHTEEASTATEQVTETTTESSAAQNGSPVIGSTAVEENSSSAAASSTFSTRSVNSDYSLPGTTALAETSSADLQSVFDNAGLDALGTGNTPPDPILGQVQISTYQMLDQNSNVIGYTATNDPGKGLFSPSGFSKFYMVHTGVARMYYRTYTDAHGWSPWCTSKQITPYNEDGSKVQAIQIRAKGYVHTLNDVYYKVILNDGTVLDWAKNGQTTGTMGTDRYIVAIRVGFWHNTEVFPYATRNLMAGSNYEGAYLDNTGTHYSSYNGQPYTGWGFIDNTQYYFIDSAPAQGWHYIGGYKYYFNADGSLVTDLESIMGLQPSYQINYNKATRTMYVLAKDGDNGYIIPFKTFNSTCGPDTPLGDYNTYVKYDVKFMHDDIYCKYLSRFYNGFIIHSILYYGSKLELDAITYNYIDDAASGGCIRLLTGNSYWVYQNCPKGTRVHIYEDPWDKGPVEKDAIEMPIPREQTWDPTDPSSAEARAALAAAAAAEEAKAAAVAAGTATLSAEDAQLAAELAASAN